MILAAAMPRFAAAQAGVSDSAIVRSEFIFDTAPFASVHASTIAETASGRVAAWFAGSSEGAVDVGIWLSRDVDGRWTPPREVAIGSLPDGRRTACWNPVLFQAPRGPLMLFYKVGPNPRDWWGMVRTSSDDGRTWGDARRLPDGVLGPIKNKPVTLRDGTIISGSSTESAATPPPWRVQFERSTDSGRTWKVVVPRGAADGHDIDAIQPSILIHGGDSVQALVRTRSDRIFETWSRDAGKTWTALAPTILPNPNAGIDAVTLRDGRQVVVYNHTTNGRSPLNVAISRDGKAWGAALVLESAAGEYSYPAVIQMSDGFLHITYTWKRVRIKHVVVDPGKLRPVPMPNGQWPVPSR